VGYDGVEVCPFVETGIPVPSSGGHHAIPRVYTAGNQDRRPLCCEFPNFFRFGPVIEDSKAPLTLALAVVTAPEGSRTPSKSAITYIITTRLLHT
jgi:hypothetical protein